MTSENPSDRSDPTLPPEIQAALKREYDPPASVPESMDRQILADADRHLSTVSNRPPTPVRTYRRIGWATGTIVAAVLLLACLPFLTDREGQPGFAARDTGVPVSTSEMSRSFADAGLSVLANDFDQNGQINVLDAYALAQQIKGDPASDFDLNGDGRTDLADADFLAMNSVTL